MTISDTIARIKEDGWAVIEGIIPDDAVGGVRDSIIATVEEHDPLRILKKID